MNKNNVVINISIEVNEDIFPEISIKYGENEISLNKDQQIYSVCGKSQTMQQKTKVDENVKKLENLILHPNEVKELRELVGMSRTEFANLADLSISTMENYENGYKTISKFRATTRNKLIQAVRILQEQKT
jgi:DNA-binding transcriptional regulator YiaG